MPDDANRIHLFCDQHPRELLDTAATVIAIAQGLGHALEVLDDEDKESLLVARRRIEEVRGHLTMRINRGAEG